MALKNSEGNYLKITDVHGNLDKDDHYMIIGSLYQNENVRNEPSKFDKINDQHFMMENSYEVPVDPNKSLRANIITNAYNYLKNNELSNWIDC